MGCKPNRLTRFSGDGIVPGARPSNGFVKNEASDVMEAIGSRNVDALPLELRFELPMLSRGSEDPLDLLSLRCPLSCRGERGAGVEP